MQILLLSEEIKIKGILHEPHFSYIESTLVNKKYIASLIFQKKEEDIFLIASSGFIIDSVFSGLTEKHIEYIAKNAPRNYKENLLKIQEDKEMMQGVFEIAKAMDKDLGESVTQNQQRVRNVIQYIKDNQAVFQF